MTNKNKSSKRRVSQVVGDNKKLLIAAIIATAGGALFQLLLPLIFKFTVDSVIGNNPVDLPYFIINLIDRLGGVPVFKQNIWLCSILIVLVSIGDGIFVYLRGRLSATASENIAKNLKDTLYLHIQKLPFNYHVKAQTGDLIQRCTSDVETVRKFLGGQAVEAARIIFVVVFAIVILLGISVKMTLVTIIIVPVIFVAALIFFTKVKATFLLADQKEGELSTVLQENLSGVRVVRAFGREQFEMEKFDKKNREFRDFIFKLNNMLSLYWSLSDLICFAQLLTVMIVGIHMTISQQITVGDFIVFNSYVGMLLWPVRQLGRILSDMGKMQISLDRIYEILNTPEEQDTEGAVYCDLKGDIKFSNLSFSYEENKPVLNNISFHIKKGETIAILGTTGSGKSTIMHILLRLYDYSTGSIQINGKELKNIKKECLREKIGIVLQEPFLFSKTIKENIRMARDGARDQDIYDVSKVASIHSSINEFEKGYDTLVGEKGVTLSGGQKQRVAIARTLIKNSDILIFDDSLSAVDTETDSQIRHALNEKSKDTTTFIISQRITTLMEADRIFVVEGGELTATGTHEELAEKDGLYKRIWNIQNMLEDDFETESGVEA